MDIDRSELIKIIRQEIAKATNIILSGQAGSNTEQIETIDNLFPGMPSVNDRPVMHPFGISSRAPAGTISVNGRMGDHPGNRVVLGHRDKGRPQIDSGEVMLYNSSGEQIYVKHGDIIFTGPKVHIGSQSADEPFVLGLVFRQFADNLLQLLFDHAHITGAPGGTTSAPINQLQFEELRQDPILSNAILSDKIFGEKE